MPVKPLVYVSPPHPSTIEEEDLLRQCEMNFGRTSGPGGQHRNKVETAAMIKHLATGIEAKATERRKQIENRRNAILRLRKKLAIDVRTSVTRGYRPSALWESRRQGKKLSVNPYHWDYPALLAEALDVIIARRFDVAGAAGMLGVTMSQLTKLVRQEKRAFAKLNEGRESVGLGALRK